MEKCVCCKTYLEEKKDKEHIVLTRISISRKIIFCKNSLIAYTSPIINPPAYENLDFHFSTKENGSDNNELIYINEMPYDWRQLLYIQTSIVSKNLPPQSQILEIGCGEGILLAELQQNGFNVTGIEPSSSAAGRAQKRNLNIITGSFPNVKTNNSYDLVIMSQVLEHIRDLDQFLCEIEKVLSSGYLLLTQTNFKGLIPRLQKEKWYAWVPEQHFWHFTLKGLTKLLKRHNFEIIEYEYSSLVHPHNLLYRVADLRKEWRDQFTVLYKLRDNSGNR